MCCSTLYIIVWREKMSVEDALIRYYGGRPQYSGGKLYKIGDRIVQYSGGQLYRIGDDRIEFSGGKLYRVGGNLVRYSGDNIYTIGGIRI